MSVSPDPGDEIEIDQTPMTSARARALLADHAHGLHDHSGHVIDDGDASTICTYARCDDAYWHLARIERP